MIAVFGAPGGAEIGIILLVILVLFVPSIGFLGLGYLLGKRSSTGAGGEPPAVAPDSGAAGAAAPEGLPAPEEPAPDSGGVSADETEPEAAKVEDQSTGGAQHE